ncbi:ABC transporter permease [Thermotoga sp. KOL6]|uniref:ABC transporter permease n=1 Tax=Thermotoga sp. KOL6 TaxID=126741 RepID=UPI000C769465|nr:ABC transporter permease [Thermotoga sp. KOL6]PLV59147.1 ABC transporter permease [Thermotoga sp. KOL6]
MEGGKLESERFLMKILRLKEMGAIVGICIFFILFMFISERFLSIENLASTFTMASELGIVAVGITMLMISGEFDLSVGSTYAVVPMVMALMMNSGFSSAFALLVSLLVGIGIGFLNGVVTLKTNIPSFITTLGMMMFWRGVLLAVTGGFPIMLEKSSKILKFFGGSLAGDLRYSGVWFIVLAFVFGLILERTAYGNWVFATGGNLGAAKALGIPTERVKLINFMISGLLAGIAGITTFGRFKIIDPTLGQGMELEAIASAVIGGSLLTGGYGSILGTFIGAFMIGMVRSGLVLAGAPAYWYRAFIGVILVISAIINAKIRKRVAG